MNIIVIYAILSAAAFIAAGQVGIPFNLVLAASGLILAAAAVVSLIDLVVHSYTKARKEWVQGSVAGELQLVNSKFAFVRLIASLTPDQLEAVGKFRATIAVEPGEIEPAYRLIVGDEAIEWPIVEEFARRCGEIDLCPVGIYPEGSARRRAAQAITGFLVANGFARAASGPYPARWADRPAGMRAIGVGEGEAS